MNQENNKIRLGVNIDHVATLRNARGTVYPDPLKMALMLEKLGVNGITAHLREDRRHIIDQDVSNLVNNIKLPINLEMAPTKEMQSIALKLVPNAVCLVPERREERTTEGGLDVISTEKELKAYIAPLLEKGIRVSLFVSAELKQIEAASRIGAPVIELNTGPFCDFFGQNRVEEYSNEMTQLKNAASRAKYLNLEVHGGHGISYETARLVAAIPEIQELNIGHFLIAESIFQGMSTVISKMRSEIDFGKKLNMGS